MSLNYDLKTTDLPNHPVTGELAWTTATQALIFYTIPLGISRITRKNAAEVFARLDMLQTLHGIPASERINAADVAQHIGLVTNATDISRAAWVKGLLSSRLDALAAGFDDLAAAATPHGIWGAVADHTAALEQNETEVMVHPHDVRWAEQSTDYQAARNAYNERYHGERRAAVQLAQTTKDAREGGAANLARIQRMRDRHL